MNASRISLLVVALLVAAAARPAVGDGCREDELDAQGRCPQQPAGKQARLDIQGADVAGAQVSLDGKVAGRAPLVVPTTPGRHRLEVKRDGYAPYAAWIEVKPGERRLVQVKLQRAAIASGKQPACSAGMVRVPAGTFRMGSPEKVGEPEEHPQHAVKLPGFCIDRTEVTLKAYLDCVAAKGCTDATAGGGDFCNQEVSGTRPFDHPINCVQWEQAAAYCKWSDKRLPTEAEWEYAARGTDGRAYPWGKQAPSAKLLNACGQECVVLGKRLRRDEIAMYNADDGWGMTAPVGSFPDGKSPFGALDMAGNVSEWTADWYGGYAAAAATSPQGAAAGTERALRGGSWRHGNPGFVRAPSRSSNDPEIRAATIGFRCAKGD